MIWQSSSKISVISINENGLNLPSKRKTSRFVSQGNNYMLCARDIPKTKWFREVENKAKINVIPVEWKQ